MIERADRRDRRENADQLDIDAWHRYRVNAEKIEKEWASERRTLESYLAQRRKEALAALCGHVGVAFISDEPTSRAADALSRSDKGKTLAALRGFLSEAGRKTAVAELFPSTGRSHFVELVSAYLSNPEVLERVAALAEWRSRRVGQQYALKNIEEVEQSSDRETVDAAFSEGGLRLRFFWHDASAKITRFAIGYERADKVMYQVEKDSRVRSVALFAIQVDHDTGVVEVRGGGRKKLDSKCQSALEAIFAGGIQKLDDSKHEPDFEVFRRFWGAEKGIAGSEVVVISARARRARVLNAPALELSEQEKRDIRPALADLQDRGILSIGEPPDLDRFSFIFKGKKYLVQVRARDGIVRLVLATKNLTAQEIDDVRAILKEQLGVELDTPITPDATAYGRAEIIDQLLQQPSLTQSELRPEERKAAGQLEDRGILTKGKAFVVFCTKCDYRDNTTPDAETAEQCPGCREDDSLKKERVQGLTLDVDKAHAYVKRLLRKIGFTVGNDGRYGFKKLKFDFIKVRRKDETHFVWLSHRRIPTRIVDWFKRGFPLLTVIHTGTSAQNPELPDWCSQVSFGDFFMRSETKKLERSFFERGFDAQLRFARDAANHAALKSSLQLGSLLSGDMKPGESDDDYKDGYFEDDTFNLLHAMFPDSLKWGKQLRGSPYPEGLLSFSWKQGNGADRTFCCAWDCKLALGDANYDLNRNEKRKIAEYVATVSELDDVGKVGGLSAMLLVSNHIGEAQLGNLADHVHEQNPDWKGVVGCLEASAVAELFRLFKEAETELGHRASIFRRRISELLTKKKAGKSYSWITAADTERVMKEVLKQDREHPRTIKPRAIEAQMSPGMFSENDDQPDCSQTAAEELFAGTAERDEEE